MINKYLFAIFSLFTTIYVANAQEESVFSDFSKLTNEDYASLQLPPLGTLIDNANNNPAIKYYELQHDQEVRELKTIRRNWLDYIKLSANYQYGMSLMLTESMDSNNPALSQYYGKAQNLYGAGATLSLPLSQFFDKRNKIKQQKSRVEQTISEKERTKEEVSIKIIDAYTAAAQCMSVMKSFMETVTLSEAQYKVTEAEFINAKVDAQTLSRQKNIYNQNIRDLEQVKSELNNALLKLELISNTKIFNR